MKNRIIAIMFVAAIMFTTLAVPAATGVIEGFNAAAEWTVDGNDISANSATATATDDTTLKTEGAGSVKFTYNYSGNLYYEARITKNFPAPVDLSDALDFTFDIYGDPANGADFIWYVRFYTESGRALRYVNYDSLGHTGWQTVTIGLGDMRYARWVNNYFDQPVINRVTGVQVIVQNQSAESAGTLEVNFDNFAFDTAGGYVDVTTIDNFDYASDAAAQAAWQFAGGGGSGDIETTTTAKQGGTAALLSYNMTTNYSRLSAILTLPAPMDMSAVNYFSFWTKGVNPPDMTDIAPAFFLYLEDANINRCRAFLINADNDTVWRRYVAVLEFDDGSGSGGAQFPFGQDPWDNGGDVDLTQITKVLLTMEENDGTPSSYTSQIIVDQMEFGTATTPPLVYSAVGDGSWDLYQ